MDPQPSSRAYEPCTLPDRGLIRIGIVDDHPLVREALRQILRDHDEFAVVGEACNGREALRLADTIAMHILIVDLSMPGKDGFDVLASLRWRAPELYLLVFSGHAEFQYARRALKEGAHGFVHKASDPAELIVALRRLAAGGRYVSRALALELALEAGEREVSPHERLSKREFQVLLGIAAGRKPGELARQLDISARTVSVYRAHLLHKLGLSTNADLTCFAIRAGLLP